MMANLSRMSRLAMMTEFGISAILARQWMVAKLARMSRLAMMPDLGI